ncbi:MAG TPA: FtsX-like permease family protein [Kiritimatiellia bacterium]|nr:FtsX-like permease family protein [Kiritimatiellia bacterium]HRU70477.1 FtsX-like permease family protein [Kiritimatiellia bacterium]
MTIWIWAQRSLRYYRARHGVFAVTAALTAALLSSALLTGESLQAGLRAGLYARLGAARSAVLLTEGVFPADLGQRLPHTEAALLLRGEVLTADGEVCASDAQIIGLRHQESESTEFQAALNDRARDVLRTTEGAVRFVKPALHAAELPLGQVKASRLVRRSLTSLAPAVSRPQDATLFPADFALRPASLPPVNVFVPLAALAESAGVPGMANLLLSSLAPQALEQALAQALTPEACGLTIEEQKTEGGEPVTVIRSRRVFLPSGLRETLEQAGLKVNPATYHLVDECAANGRRTPYGFVAAVTPDGVRVPRDLRDDETVLNAWLADSLGVTTRASVTVTWHRFEAGGRLVETQGVFRVRRVIPMEVAAEARRAMPVFPGLEGVDSCAAWDVGLPMDEERLNDAANEAYWKAWRETPKLFLTHATGKAAFGTVFGDAMSLSVAADATAVRAALRNIAPARLGFQVRPIWQEGLAAARGTTDFRLLFVGMAFIVVAASLLLVALSLALALEARRNEIALLRALGWGRGRVALVLTVEWSVPLCAGSVAGSCGGALLARALVWSLGRFWRDAFAGAEPLFLFSAPVALVAAIISIGLTLLVLLHVTRRYAVCLPAAVWQMQDAVTTVRVPEKNASPRRVSVASMGGGVLALAALAIMEWSPEGTAANGAFFGAGFLLMVSVLLFLVSLGEAWRRAAAGRSAVRSPVAAGIARALAVPRRSAPVVILLAVGLFLSVGILAMKHDPAAGSEHPWSGSGGFRAIVTSTVAQDRARGLELARKASGAEGVVPVRVREGDDAGCLNMNAPQTPRLLGLEARVMARARAFEPREAGGVWSPLERLLPDGAIPALAADQAMLQYSLKAKAGVTDGKVMTYTGSDGTPWRVRIVGALPVRSGILQGALLIDERFFVQMFPEEGYRMWLCDYAPYALREAADAAWRPTAGQRLQVAALRHPAPGVTVETVEERLRALGAIEASYLDLFLVLGALGLLLGTAGLSLVILRGVDERRGEFALLAAVGVARRDVIRLLAAEYGLLVAAGLAAGVLPALVAIQPAARSLGGALPWEMMAIVIAMLLLCAAGCVWGAACAAARRFEPDALRDL